MRLWGIIPRRGAAVKVTSRTCAGTFGLSLGVGGGIAAATGFAFLDAHWRGSIVNPEDRLDARDAAPMADRTYRWLLITVAMLGLSVDQASKYGVFRWLYNNPHYTDPKSQNSFVWDPFRLVPVDCPVRSGCASSVTAVSPASRPGALR